MVTDRKHRLDGFEERELEWHGTRLRYAVGGGGPPLVLVHGLGGTVENWRALAPPLAARHRVLVPDLPGATRSMLQKSGLSSAENWIFSDGYAERLRFEIDPSWQGDIPRTMLISRDGEVTTIEGSAEIADLEKWSDEKAPLAK